MKKTESTKIKVAALLYDIYIKCNTKTPFVLSNLIKDISLTSNTATIIKQMNIVERGAKQGGGYLYKWTAETPNDEFINRVSTNIQEYAKTACNPKQKPVPVSVEITTPEFPAMPPNMPGPLQTIFTMIADNARQQAIFLNTMGIAVEEMRHKIDYIFSTHKN